jgi:pimeloyl-ACP methyl ester carboxylesterase
MDRQSIMGHSMGGHGALTIGLSFPQRYKAISAFAPIVAPSQAPWGHKALGGYLGPDRATWRRHDAVALIEDGARVDALLIDQGEEDPFLGEQLKPQYRSFNNLDSCEDVNGRRGTISFSPDRVVAHLSFHASFVTAVAPGREAFVEDFGQDGIMPCRSLSRGE